MFENCLLQDVLTICGGFHPIHEVQRATLHGFETNIYILLDKYVSLDKYAKWDGQIVAMNSQICSGTCLRNKAV